ncbi:MAG TPA: hypothetical protein VII48_05260, partial [Rhizomicrobium sp.]
MIATMTLHRIACAALDLHAQLRLNLPSGQIGYFYEPLRPSHLIGATATSPVSVLTHAQGR